jgi:hypothetical protein
VAAPLRLAGPHWKHRLAAVQRLDLGFFVNAKHHGMLGRGRYSPTTSRTFATKSGSVESLNVSCRCGFNLKARQIRCVPTGSSNPCSMR